MNKRKAKGSTQTLERKEYQLENIRKDIKLLTGVYEREIGIATSLLSEARVQRQKKYAEMKRVKRKRIKQAIDHFKNTEDGKMWRELRPYLRAYKLYEN